jgi:hypothetical protein
MLLSGKVPNMCESLGSTPSTEKLKQKMKTRQNKKTAMVCSS